MSSENADVTALAMASPAPVVTMRYGELVIRFTAAGEATRFRVPPEYEEFRAAADAEPHFDVEWRVEPFALPSEPPVLRTEVWDHWMDDRGLDAMVFYRGHDREPWALLRFDWAGRRAVVVQDARALGSDVADLGFYPLSEILATRMLSRLEVANLHASSAVLDGRAYLFLGHSGAGKSTISEIALGCGATVLSDDRTIVGLRDGRAIAWGTPWHGTGRRSSSRTAPIAGIFLLRQAEAESATRVAPARAVKEMFVRTINPRLTPAESQDTLRVVESLGAVVPMWELGFRPVPEAFSLAVRVARDASR